MRVGRIHTSEQIKLDLLNEMQKTIRIDLLSGNYKAYKNNLNRYVKFASQNKYLLYEQKPIENIRVSLFTKEGLSVFKIAILNLFRKKSPEEKELINYVKKMRLEDKYC